MNFFLSSVMFSVKKVSFPDKRAVYTEKTDIYCHI